MTTTGPADAGEPGDDVGEFLAIVPLFAELPPHLRAFVGARCRSERVPAGSWLFRQHDEGGALFIVRRGRLEVMREDPPPAMAIRIVSKGEAIGELGLLMGTPRLTSVRALRDSELLRLDREALDELLGVSPDFAADLLRVIGNRVRHRVAGTGQQGKRPNILSVVHLDAAVPVDPIREGFVAALATRGTVASLDGTEVARDAHRDEDRVAEWARRLDSLEGEHDYVVLVAPIGEEDDGWTNFCIRHGDRVVAVTRPAQRPQVSTVPTGGDLLLWTGGTSAQVLAPWLEGMQPRSHFFVDPRNPAPGLARAARRLTSGSVGVVLCGGGARALASIGVLDELSSEGLAIDRLGGSGFGALVAGMFALGMPPGEIARRCRAEFVQRRAFSDFTAPRVSLLRGRRFGAVLDRVFGEARIEQLTRPFFCVSADIGSAELVVHRRGRLTNAVSASTALPGLLPPVLDDGRVLFDGSVLDNLPVAVMAADDEGPVLAVDVTRRRWTGRGRRGGPLPAIADTISRSAILGGSQHAADSRRIAHLVIEPSPPEVGQLGFERLDEIVESGRIAARAALEHCRELVDALIESQ